MSGPKISFPFQKGIKKGLKFFFKKGKYMWGKSK